MDIASRRNTSIRSRRMVARQSDKFVYRKREKMAIVGGLCAVIAISAVFVASRLSYISALNIQTIEVYGADSKLVPDIRAAAFNALQGSYLGLFSKSNTLLYSKNAVKESVIEAVPSAEGLSVSMGSAGAMVVTVAEKTPSAVICGGLPDWDGAELTLASIENCYFADKSGYIYGVAPAYSDGVFNRYFIPSLSDSSSGSAVGKTATSSETFKVLQDFYETAKATGISVKALLINDSGTYEMYFDDSEDFVSVIHMSESFPIAEQKENLVLFWKNHLKAEQEKNDSIKISDIQLQFPPNVYYTEAKTETK